jgi:hypothetical protein
MPVASRYRARLHVVAGLVLLAGCGSADSSAPVDTPSPVATVSAEPTRTATATTAPTASATPTSAVDGGVDYIVGGVWHQPDGDAVDLPKRDYSGAVLWNGKLVATRYDGEAFYNADVIDGAGKVVETLRTTSTVVVNDAGTTLAWVDTEGDVMTAWADGRVRIGKVPLAAAGEGVAYYAAAVTGGPNCNEAADGCIVYLNSRTEKKPRAFDSHGVNENPLPFVLAFNDVTGDSLVTYTDKISDDGSCGGLVDLGSEGAEPRWKTCDHTTRTISPDGKHVIGWPPYLDGIGLGSISVLDAATGKETGRYAPEGGFMSSSAWTSDGRVLFDVYSGGKWQLIAMSPTGEITEIGKAVAGEDADSPFAFIEH